MNIGKASDRGQVLIIFVFAAIGLVAMTGLAIDGASVFSDRRHAQNAADTAALAGALEKINNQKAGQTGCTDLTTPTPCGAAVADAALNVAGDNGYGSDVINNTVEVHIPPVDGAYSNCSNPGFTCTDYIQVIISTNVNTFFARVLGINQLHNRVEAVALAKYAATSQLFGGDSLVSLAPTGTDCTTDHGEFSAGGNTTITLNGGGIFVNSNGPCAFNNTNCITLTGSPNPPVNVVGGSYTPSSCGPPNTVPTIVPASAVQFPPDPLFTTPTECGTTGTMSSSRDANGFFDLYPGYFSQLPPPGNNTDYLLTPGVYCVDSVIKITSPKTKFWGTGVFIWYKPGGYFSFQGGSIQLSAPTTGQYKGYLMYVDSTYQTSPDQNCTINGGTGDFYTGVIYAPNCAVTVNGNSGSTGWGAQIIGYTMKINGGSILTFNYNNTPQVSVPEKDWTGLFH